MDTFDKGLIAGLNTEKPYPEFIKSFALTLGSFILPKFTIRGFTTTEGQEDNKKIVFRDSEKGTLFVTKENSPFMRNIKKFASKGKANLRHISSDEVTFEILDVSECLMYDITSDFFGVLSDMDLKDKKMHVLSVYRLLFRFSIFALMSQLDNTDFLLIVLQYLSDT
jgi:hypothetical protein